MESLIATRMATLGHPKRLAIFRLLMRRYPGRMPAGEIAAVLGVKASTLSAYLSALQSSGLICQERIGTSLRYGINLTQTGQTFDYLLYDCCRGRPDLCAPLTTPTNSSPGASTMDSTFNVLFLCTGNSARSIFAEALLRNVGAGRFKAYSAGTRPASELNPFALKVLDDKGHDIADLRSKNVSEMQGPDAPVFDFVFTVCDQAANEECPPWGGQPISAHWGQPDPVKAEGSDAEKSLAFQQVYGALRNRIIAFTQLPLHTLDRISLQKAVDTIAEDTAFA